MKLTFCIQLNPDNRRKQQWIVLDLSNFGEKIMNRM